MLVNICVSLAVGIFVAALAAALRNRHAVSRRITILLAGICLSSFCLFLPAYWELSCKGVEDGLAYPPGLRSLAYTLFYSLKAISGGQQIQVVEAMGLKQAHPVIRHLYFWLNYGFFIGAPVLTSSLVLSLIGDLADQLRCRIYSGGTCCVFSELNENTLRLAEKIREKYRKELMVFCNTRETPKELRARAKATGAVLLYAPCTGAKLRLRNKHLQFYLVSANEDTNLRHAEELICKYREENVGSCVINAFAQSGTGIQMVENMDRGNVGIRFVDATALLCSNILLHNPLHDLPEGSDTISVMIVGCGKTGMRMLKTVTWCGAVENCRLKIQVYDKNAELLENTLRAQCPELMENCDVAFVTADADTCQLEQRVLDPEKGSADATCILIAMDDDERNIAVAERLSRLFRHHNRYARMPQILVRIRNSTKSEIYKEQESPYLKQRRIYPFGGVDDIFSEGMLHHSYLENLAFAVDLCYSGLLPQQDPMTMTLQQLRAYFASGPVRSVRSHFLQSEYNRRSAMATALHIPVKLHSCGILSPRQNIPTPEDGRRFRQILEENPAMLDTLAKNEHLRWNRFMRSEGYAQARWEDLLCFYPLQEKKSNQDVLSKRHLCLVEWEELDEINRKYLTLDPPVKKNFKKTDYDLIIGIPEILALAKRMEELSLRDLT